MVRMMLVMVAALYLSACNTTGHFKIPKDTRLELHGRETAVAPDGKVITTPFSWSAAGGVPYRLLSKDGKVLTEGKARARFRVVSIFWPPFAIFYWPIGFNSDVVNDLTSEGQKSSKKTSGK